MIVVSNTSPIVNLAAVGRLDLLRDLYKEVHIAAAVGREISKVGARLGALGTSTPAWISSGRVTNRALVIALQADLDEGESEAIAQAIDLKADLILLDERRARSTASRLGLKRIGLLGILLQAKAEGCLPAVKPVLDELISKAGFWIGSQLYARVLLAAGE